MRLIWLLFFRPQSVWVCWFKEVVLKGSVNNFWTTKPSQSFSWLTNKLLKLGKEVYPFICLRIGNGESIRFWTDHWSPFGCLQNYLEGGRTRLGISKEATLASLHRNGAWQIPGARTERQLQVLTYITTIVFSEESEYCEWEVEGTISGKYSTDQIYHHLRGPIESVDWAKAVWTSRNIPRHSFNAWMVVLNRLPTRDRMIGWGLQVPAICLLCNAEDESRDHIFWDCDFAFQLWTLVAGRCGIQPRRRWEDSLNQMIALTVPSTIRSLVLLGWQATIYWIWHERNQRLHANKFRSVDSLISQIDHQIRNKLQSFRDANPRRSSAMMQQWLR